MIKEKTILIGTREELIEHITKLSSDIPVALALGPQFDELVNISKTSTPMLVGMIFYMTSSIVSKPSVNPWSYELINNVGDIERRLESAYVRVI